MRNAYKFLVGEPEGKRPLGRLKRRWDNIKMDIEMGLGSVGWFHMTENMDWWRAVTSKMY
jgi:hypothetical protein